MRLASRLFVSLFLVCVFHVMYVGDVALVVDIDFVWSIFLPVRGAGHFDLPSLLLLCRFHGVRRFLLST
jgi:hypothetical protein